MDFHIKIPPERLTSVLDPPKILPESRARPGRFWLGPPNRAAIALRRSDDPLPKSEVNLAYTTTLKMWIRSLVAYCHLFIQHRFPHGLTRWYR